MIHYKDIFTKESECGKKGKLTINTWEVNCFDCLNSSKIEWERQIKKFSGQPLINAKEGLKRVEERMKKLGFLNKDLCEEGGEDGET